MPVSQVLVGIFASLGTFVVLAPLVVFLGLPPRQGRPLREWLQDSPRRVLLMIFIAALVAGLAGIVVASVLGFEVVDKLAVLAAGRG